MGGGETDPPGCMFAAGSIYISREDVLPRMELVWESGAFPRSAAIRESYVLQFIMCEW